MVRSSVPIAKGDMLCTTYTYTLSGTRIRQEHLKEGKYFVCHCKRCIDPSELGTNFSTIICQKCDNGNILPLNPLGEIFFKKIIELKVYLNIVFSLRCLNCLAMCSMWI